jgi:zinc transport system substrate-binding protein
MNAGLRTQSERRQPAARCRIPRAAVAGLQLLVWSIAGLIVGCNPDSEVPRAAARDAEARQPARIATANSYLSAVVRDWVGSDEAIVALAEPGSCPGHFDVRPSQLRALRSCRLLVRFDFQQGLAERLEKLRGDGLRVASIQIVGGMGVPAGYLDAAEQVGALLVDEGWLTPAEATERAGEIRTRLERLDAELRERVATAGLVGLPVITSWHQEAFCEYLGLEVAGTFTGADTALASNIDAAVRAGLDVRGVVANEPEGRRLADTIAARLDVPVVVFANFPDEARHDGRFDELVRSNVAALLATFAP